MNLYLGSEGVHYCINHISSAPTVKLVHFLPTSRGSWIVAPLVIQLCTKYGDTSQSSGTHVYVVAVAMPRTPQSPSLRRFPWHDKRKHSSESGVRRDERRTSPTRETKKKRGNAKATEDNTKGAKKNWRQQEQSGFASSRDEDDNDAMRMIMMPHLWNHLGVISKRMIWKTLTNVLPAAVQECWRQREGKWKVTRLSQWRQAAPRNQLLWKLDECLIAQKMKTIL